MELIDTGKTKPDRGLTSVTTIVSVIIIAVLVFAAISAAAFVMYGSGTGGFGSGQSGGGINSAFSVNNTSFNRMNSVPAGALVNNSSNSINVTSKSVTLIVEAAPTWYPRHGDFWLIYGLVNPNIVIREGTTVHFVFINMDNITHMPAITTIGPPYSYMPMQGNMMGSGTDSGSGMMGYQSGGNGSWLAIGPSPMLPGTSANAQDQAYAASNLTVTFSSSGNYYYICLIPGHAQMGMYGEISVQG